MLSLIAWISQTWSTNKWLGLPIAERHLQRSGEAKREQKKLLTSSKINMHTKGSDDHFHFRSEKKNFFAQCRAVEKTLTFIIKHILKLKNTDRNQENSVKLITLAQRYANVVKRWEGSIYELLMTIVFVEAWRKRGFGVLLFWNWNRNFLHVDIGLHIKRTTVIGWETKGPTRAWAIVLKTIKQLTTSWCQPIKNHKNIATYIILARHQKIGEYIYTQLNIFFRGNFF